MEALPVDRPPQAPSPPRAAITLRWSRLPNIEDPPPTARPEARRRRRDLLADLEPAEDPQARAAHAQAVRAEHHAQRRRKRAAEWRAVRRRFRALPPHVQEEVASRWNASSSPADPAYLADLITTAGFPDPERPEEAIPATAGADPARSARLQRGASWIRHVPCDGAVDLVGRPPARRARCFGCGKTWSRSAAVEAVTAGELTWAGVCQEMLSL